MVKKWPVERFFVTSFSGGFFWVTNWITDRCFCCFLFPGPKKSAMKVFSENIQPPGASKCPFHPLVGGHLSPWKGHLTIPKRSRLESPGVAGFFPPIWCPARNWKMRDTGYSISETNSTGAPVRLHLFPQRKGWKSSNRPTIFRCKIAVSFRGEKVTSLKAMFFSPFST